MNSEKNVLLMTKKFPKITPCGEELINKFNHNNLMKTYDWFLIHNSTIDQNKTIIK